MQLETSVLGEATQERVRANADADAPPLTASSAASFFACCSSHRVTRFYERRGSWILLAWLVVFGICAATGPQFLSLLRGGSQLPPGSPVEAAVKAGARLFPPPPQGAPESPSVVVQRARSGGVTSGQTAAASRNFSVALARFCADKGAGVVAGVQGFWELAAAGPLLARVAARALAPDNATMATSVAYLPGAADKDVVLFIRALAEWAPAQSSELLEVTTTGNRQISLEWSSELNADFVRTEGIVLPIAMVALGAQLRSYRHMGIALLNLIVTLLLSFAVLVPVAQKGVLDLDPSALLIMASLGIALSFDYSLFILSRFREERAGPRAASKLDSVERSLHTSGHAVALSGSILIGTYLLLSCFPNDFLRSVGVTCAAVTAAAVVTNLSIVPCLLLSLDCFSHFDACPSRTSCASTQIPSTFFTQPIL